MEVSHGVVNVPAAVHVTPIKKPSGGRDMDDVSVISCDECAMQHTDVCDDCVVTFICGRDPDEAVVIDVVEARAVRLLGDVGLVPRLRQVPRQA
jgi:hypothetical protein